MTCNMLSLNSPTIAHKLRNQGQKGCKAVKLWHDNQLDLWYSWTKCYDEIQFFKERNSI